MKFEDDTQNLKARMAIIHGLVIAILAVLGARLYFLQVVNGDYYAERAENQRVRRLRIPAPRGAIFDRSGKLLVDSRSTYNIILSGEDMKGKDLNELVEPLSEGLDVAPDIMRERFEQAGHLERPRTIGTDADEPVGERQPLAPDVVDHRMIGGRT